MTRGESEDGRFFTYSPARTVIAAREKAYLFFAQELTNIFRTTIPSAGWAWLGLETSSSGRLAIHTLSTVAVNTTGSR